MKIVVIGGHGLIGSRVVEGLARLGHDAVAASRRSGVDVLTGEGLARVLEGAQAVVDACNAPIFEDPQVGDFFRSATTQLLAACERASVQHLVGLSIVGTPYLQDSAYFRAKAVQEDLVHQSDCAPRSSAPPSAMSSCPSWWRHWAADRRCTCRQQRCSLWRPTTLAPWLRRLRPQRRVSAWCRSQAPSATACSSWWSG